MPRIKQYDSQLGFDASRVPSSGGVTAPISSAGQEWGALAHLGNVAGDVATKVYERKLQRDDMDRETALTSKKVEVKTKTNEFLKTLNDPTAMPAQKKEAHEGLAEYLKSVSAPLTEEHFQDEITKKKLKKIGITERNQNDWKNWTTEFSSDILFKSSGIYAKAVEEEQVAEINADNDQSRQLGYSFDRIASETIAKLDRFKSLGMNQDRAEYLKIDILNREARLETDRILRDGDPIGLKKIANGDFDAYFPGDAGSREIGSIKANAKKGLDFAQADSISNEQIAKIIDPLDEKTNEKLRNKIKAMKLSDDVKDKALTLFNTEVNRRQESQREQDRFQSRQESDAIQVAINNGNLKEALRLNDKSNRTETEKAVFRKSLQETGSLPKSDQKTLWGVRLSIQKNPSSYSEDDIYKLVDEGKLHPKDAEEIIDKRAKRLEKGKDIRYTLATNRLFEAFEKKVFSEDRAENEKRYAQELEQLENIPSSVNPIDYVDERIKSVNGEQAEKETGDILDRLWGWTKGVVGMDDDEVAPKEGSNKVEPRKPNETIQEYLKRTGKK